MAEETNATSGSSESYNYLSYVLAMFNGEDTDKTLWEGNYEGGVLPF